MDIPAAYLFTLTFILGLEYSLKQFWETISTKLAKPIVGYVVYRILHLVLLCILGMLFVENVRLVHWIMLSAVLVFVGSLEIVVAVIHVWLQHSFDLRWRWLYYIHTGFLVFVSISSAATLGLMPRISLNFKLVFLFVFLAHPANYMIRWMLDKGEHSLPEDVAVAILQSRQSSRSCYSGAAEVGVSSETGQGEPSLGTLRAGRIVGILERWLILILVLTGNISSMGFIIAAKSIVRYPRLNDPDFAEYYLLGTLYSVVLALLSGVLLLGGIE